MVTGLESFKELIMDAFLKSLTDDDNIMIVLLLSLLALYFSQKGEHIVEARDLNPNRPPNDGHVVTLNIMMSQSLI